LGGFSDPVPFSKVSAAASGLTRAELADARVGIRRRHRKVGVTKTPQSGIENPFQAFLLQKSNIASLS